MSIQATENVEILILGAGPTGLGAATRLQVSAMFFLYVQSCRGFMFMCLKMHGHQNWLMIDAFAGAGGFVALLLRATRIAHVPTVSPRSQSHHNNLCPVPRLACTDVTAEGFLFDMGGHVIFSHFQYFDDLIDAAVGVGDEYWCINMITPRIYEITRCTGRSTHQRISYVWLKNVSLYRL